MKGKSISLIVPNLNSGATLARALQSIIEQEVDGLQLIVVDGGSTDESLEICTRYWDAIDVLISEPDRGQADGINKGLAKASGDIVGWLCADDELLPGALEHVQEQFARLGPADVLVGRCERVFPDGSRFIAEVDSNIHDNICLRNTIEQPSTFWPRSLQEAVGPLDNSYYLSFDWVNWIRMRNAGATFHTTERVLSRYVFSENNKCNIAGNLFAEEAFRVIEEYGPLNGEIAEAYRTIYRYFDLRGCLDRPRRCSLPLYLQYLLTYLRFSLRYGSDYMRAYNWHFASLQERGIPWWQ